VTAAANPYAPPKARVADVGGADPGAEAIRREHIKHEASIRSVGILYYIGGVLASIAGIGFVGFAVTDAEAALGWAVVVLYLAVGALSIAVARGLRAFKPWARTTCIVLSFIGLLGFPIGTLINGYILYLLFAAKGRRIFEPDYPAIVAATPHIEYRTSALVWVVVALLLLAIVAAIVVPMLDP
jgi:hypothetical protein